MFSRLATTLTRHARATVTPLTGPVRRVPVRRLGGGGHGHDDFHISQTHLQVATVMTTVCWVWMLWRAYEDGAVVLGLEHPWEGHGHGHHGPGVEYEEENHDTPPQAKEAEEHHH